MKVEITAEGKSTLIDNKPITLKFLDEHNKETFCVGIMPALLEKQLMAMSEVPHKEEILH